MKKRFQAVLPFLVAGALVAIVRAQCGPRPEPRLPTSPDEVAARAIAVLKADARSAYRRGVPDTEACRSFLRTRQDALAPRGSIVPESVAEASGNRIAYATTDGHK